MITGDEPAFPMIQPGRLETWETTEGETLLQKWSGMAMQGMLAAQRGIMSSTDDALLAERAVMIAKALIAELNKEQP